MLKEFKTTHTSSRVTSTSSSSSSTEVRSTVRTSCRKQLFSPNDIDEEAVFDNPVRRRKGNKPRPTSPLPRPKRKRRRDNAGSVASSDGSTASRQSQHSVPNQNKRVRKPRDHKSVHDRAVSRVLGSDRCPLGDVSIHQKRVVQYHKTCRNGIWTIIQCL